MTLREFKLPNFEFDVAQGSCNRVTLISTESQLVLAERDEFGEKITSNLFDGVWMKSERVIFDRNVNCLIVLRQLHPGLYFQERCCRTLEKETLRYFKIATLFKIGQYSSLQVMG